MTLETRISDLALAVANSVNTLKTDKVDKITGKGLSTNDFTNAEKSALAITNNIIKYTAMSGTLNGGDITLTGGINFSISAGSGFVRDASNNIIEISWNILTDSVPVAGDNFIYLDYNGNIVFRTLKEDSDNIFIGYITTDDTNTSVLGFNNNKFLYDQYFSNLNKFVENAMGTMVEYGFELSTQSSPDTLKVNLSSGALWQDFNQFIISNLSTFRKFYKDSTHTYYEDTSTPNYINNNHFNDTSLTGTNALIPMTAGYYKKDLFFISTKGNLFYQHGISQYAEAEHAFSAEPPIVNPASTNVTVIAHIIIQEGNPVPIAIIDMRASFERLWDGHYFKDLIPTIPHHSIQGLLEDDHTQYHNDARGDIRYYTKTELDAGQLNTQYYTETEINSFLTNKANSNHIHNNANTTTDGFMSASDFNKLSDIENNATANQTDAYLLSRTNHTGTQDVSTITGLVKASVGLGNVDNTSDINKPISTLTQTELNNKVDKITGKSLSTNDFTNYYKSEVDLSTNMATELGSSVNVSGGIVSLTGGVGFSISPGVGYTRDNTDKMVRVSWNTLTGSCLYDSDNFINIDYQGNIVISTGAAQGDLIALGYIRTSFANTVVVGFSNTRLRGKDFSVHMGELFRTSIGSIVQSGCNTAMQVTPNDLKITVSSGYIWSLFNRFTFPDTSTFTKLFNSSDYGFIPDSATTANTVNTDYWNNHANPAATALVPLSNNYYKKDLIAITPEGTVFYVYGTAEYSNIDDARTAPTPPVPESIKLSVIRSASILVRQGETTITELFDVRPMFSRLFDTGQAATNSTIISHSNLTDLGNDDHTQYLNSTRGDLRYYRKSELDSGSLDTRYYTESEITTLLTGKSSTGHTHVSADITDLSPTTVGLGNVPNTDATNASNISTGTLANNILTANLNSIGNIVKVNGDIISVVGGVYAARTISQYKSDLALNNVVNVDTSNASNISTGTLSNNRLTTNIKDIGNITFNSGDLIQYDGTNLVNVSVGQIKTNLVLVKGDVGLGNVANVDTTNASNISTGTLSNSRLSTNLSQLGNLTLSTGDYFQFNGATIVNVTSAAVKSSLSLIKGDVGLGNVANVDTTNASNISAGTLSNNRLSTNLGQIGALTLSTNDIIYYNGSVLTNITPSSYKTLLSLTKSDVGLGNVVNSLQVINTGGFNSISAGLNSAKPVVGTAGRFYKSIDNGITYYDNGTTWEPQLPAYIGDVTSTVNGDTLTLATVNSNVGTFGSTTTVPVITTNAKGLTTSISTVALTNASVGLGNVANVDTTNASNISTGTLANNRLTTNLSQLGGITFATNDFIQYNGTTLVKVTPSSVKTSLAITKSDVGLSNVPNVDTTNAGNITTGVLPLSVIPAGALDRLVIVADQTARFALTIASVQNGDTVKQNDTGIMYYVIDDTNLNSSIGYEIYTAGAATSVPYSGITSLPTNLLQLGGISFSTNDLAYYNGSILTNITPSSYKALLSLTKSDVGLSNVVNSLQVINAGNGTSLASGNTASRPTAGTNGRVYASTDNGLFLDNGTSWVLQQAAITGDISISVNSTTATLATVNSNVGTFNNVTVNGKGLVTAASNVAYITGNQTITISGDLTGSGTTSIVVTLPTVNSNVGTFNNVTVNGKGLVTAASNVAYITGNQTITVSGDLSGTGTTGLSLTLATVNSNVGTFGSTTTVPVITTNAKGLTTAISTVALTSSSVGLGNLTNSLQVINAGGVVSHASGTNAARPVVGTSGRLYSATDNGITYYDNGTTWNAQLPAYTGDVSSTLGGTSLTLSTVNANVGTFNNVTVNGKGLVTAASNVSYLTNNQSITLSGDFSGTGTTSITGTLATVNSNVGTFNNVTVNGKGLVTSASNIAYITGNQTITVSGDLTGSGTTGLALTLATVNSNVGTFNNVTVNGKGLVTAASNVAYITGNQTITLSGDISGSGTTGIAGTLATVNSNVGTFGSTTVVPVITVNGKGLTTAISTVALTNASVGLGNVANSLQVINAGGAVSYAIGTNAAKPAFGTAGRLYKAIDQGITYYDSGTAWSAQLPAYTGDVSSTLGGTALTLATVNSNVGTFNNVIVNGKGLVTAASNVAYITGNQTITLSGDITGSGTTGIAGTLATVNANVGTFNNVTVNGKGLVTAASNVGYITGNQTITLSGDLTGSGTTGIAGTLATVNSNVGTFNNVTVNGKGLVTAASNVAYITGNQTITLSGDITGSGTTGIAGTLATVNTNVGTFNNVTINAKGLATAGSNANYLLDPGTNGILVRTALNTTGWRSLSGTVNQTTITNGDGVAGNPTVAIANNPVIPGTASITIPSGTTAQRDTPTNGQLRYNTTLGYAEISDTNVYRPLGKVAQFLTGNIVQTTGTTILPYDATLPLSTEGFQIWTQAITPTYTNSTIVVIFNVSAESSTAGNATTMALFNGTTAIATSTGMMVTTTNSPFSLGITKTFTSGTISPITLSARIGPNAAATVYVNRGNTETFAGTTNTSYIIMEII